MRNVFLPTFYLKCQAGFARSIIQKDKLYVNLSDKLKSEPSEIILTHVQIIKLEELLNLSDFDRRTAKGSSCSAKKIRAITPVIGLLGALLSTPQMAHADSGSNFLETIGISIVVGAVLGASTLPFYDQPGKHLTSVGFGAAAGAVAGLGVYAFEAFSGTSETSGSTELRESAGTFSSLESIQVNQLAFDYRRLASPTPLIWCPLVSLNW